MGGIEPSPHGLLGIDQGLVEGQTLRCTPWQFGHGGNEGSTLVAPVDGRFVVVSHCRVYLHDGSRFGFAVSLNPA